MTIRLLLADDQALVRGALSALLGLESDLEVVAEVGAGDLVLPAGAFDPGHADEIRALAAQAAVYATHARGPGTLRAYRSAWRQYDAWCVRLGLPALSGDPRLVGMYLTAAAERLAGRPLDPLDPVLTDA